ncbi:MAG: hypothetical protein OXN27_18895 [Candidatus Poribacteria bacterium]|nr:hypothetical protein [Candidatus Poribacteria bacterium]
MRRFTCILTILMCVFTYNGILSVSNPTKPDSSIYSNAERQYNDWWRKTINPAKTNVDNAFKAAMKIANDFKNANDAMRNTMYKGLPAGMKKNMVSSLSSALGISAEIATNRAKAMTLADAAYTAFDNHTTKLDTFNDYWDRRGTVTESDTLALMQAELNQHGAIGVQAYSLMGAFHRLEYALGIFNIKAEAWNKHSPSDPVQIQYFSDPIKPIFSTVGCFNHCGNFFDTFSSAESSHKKKCGTASSIESVAAPPRRLEIRRSRSVSQGCGRDYYHCPNKPNTQHEPQTCSTSGCSVKYRNCLPHTKDHSNHSTTTETTQNEFQQPPPTPPPTPSYHPCGVHATSVSGDHSAAGCGVSGHYVCDGSDHSLQASCTTTNASGQSCTASSFYACQTHTHQYPTTATCSQCNKVYTPSSYSSNRWHKARTCTKQKWLQVDGRWVKVRCTNTFYKCTNGNWQCATGEMWCRDADGS